MCYSKHLRMLDCEACIILHTLLRNKWDALIFVGYHEKSKGYKLTEPKTKEKFTFRKYKHNEDKIKITAKKK